MYRFYKYFYMTSGSENDDKKSESTKLSATHTARLKVPCAFCRRDVDDEYIYGKCYSIGDIQCHYSCVNLSSKLQKRGENDEGLFGYLYDDMLAEIERSKNSICSYCSNGGATLSCAARKCRSQLHFPCGRDRHAVFLFHGVHRLFCEGHAPSPDLSKVIIQPNNNLVPKMTRVKNVVQEKDNHSDHEKSSNYLIEHHSECIDLTEHNYSQKSKIGNNPKKRIKVKSSLCVPVTKSSSRKKNSSVDKTGKGMKTMFVSQKKRTFVKRRVESAPDWKTRSSLSIIRKDMEYEVLEQENDCNILIVKV